MFLQALYLVQYGNRHISNRHLDGRCYILSGNESETATHTEYTVIMSFFIVVVVEYHRFWCTHARQKLHSCSNSPTERFASSTHKHIEFIYSF